jgi:galactan endo-beta-1,3-galactanase
VLHASNLLLDSENMKIAASALAFVLVTGIPATADAAAWEDVISTGSFGSYSALESAPAVC